MASAGWYGDPTRTGRLRYWDGSAWTEHVSEGGGTATEPITGIPPAPPVVAPAGASPATGAAPATEPAGARPAFDTGTGVAPATDDAPTGLLGGVLAGSGRAYDPTILGRAGLVVAALGGVLVASSAGSTAVDQGFITISVAGGSWIGVIAAVLCVAAAAAPWVWARIAGVTASALFAIIVAFALIGFRSSDDLTPGVDVSLGGAGYLMLFGSLLLFAGTAVALAGLRVPARAPDPGRNPAQGKAVSSLVLGIVGVLIPFAAAPAVGLGLFALDDDTVTGGRIGNRGLAKAGIILGIVSLSLWGFGLLLGMLLAQP